MPFQQGLGVATFFNPHRFVRERFDRIDIYSYRLSEDHEFRLEQRLGKIVEDFTLGAFVDQDKCIAISSSYLILCLGPFRRNKLGLDVGSFYDRARELNNQPDRCSVLLINERRVMSVAQEDIGRPLCSNR